MAKLWASQHRAQNQLSRLPLRPRARQNSSTAAMNSTANTVYPLSHEDPMNTYLV